MVSGSAPGTLERKIYFYRADIGTDEGGQRLAFDPSPALDAIDCPLALQDGEGAGSPCPSQMMLTAGMSLTPMAMP